MGEVPRALKNLIEALKLSPTNSEYLAQYSKLCLLINEEKRALIAARKALDNTPKDALTLDTIGVVLTKLGEYQQAHNVLELAVSKQGDNAQFNFNLASAAQFLGKFETAKKHYLKAIDLNKHFSRAYWAYSELNKNEPHDKNFEAKLEKILKHNDLQPDDELYLCHALSREREKADDFEAAFEYLDRGKSKFRATVNYSHDDDKKLFNSIETRLWGESTVNRESSIGQEAIFVVGMPRSGTTLVERIISSCPAVQSLGEIQNLAHTVKKASRTRTPNVLDAEVIENLSSDNFLGLGEAYLGSIINRDQHHERFIDKTPLNFLLLGVIAAALPASKVVIVRRNALDTCLSNYRQLFSVGFSYYNYNYNMEDLANYYVLFDNLIEYWQKLYPKRFHMIQYEELLDEPSRVAKQLFDYIEIPWQENYLDFHNHQGPVATASAMQVRQPIYRDAIKRWKRYEKQLTSVASILTAANINY
ncbi:MAG: sulfotransferase [Acidiferrobacterales bacterium]|nr:sulfotransferase [Acidiferrobacterales bacterium]